MPHGTDSAPTTASAPTGTSTTWSQRRRVVTSAHATSRAGPTSRLLVETAAPASSVIAITRPHDGRTRYATATATALVANAAAGPSPVSGPVVQSSTPLTAVSPAASSARPRSIVWTPIEYTASVTTMPAS